MNSFIDEVTTQGDLLKSVSTYYRGEGLKEINRIATEFRDQGMRRIILTGMGSSLYATDAIRGYLTSHGICSLSFSSFELSRYQFNQIDDRTLVIAISQSGGSPEVIELVEKANKVTRVVGLYNKEECQLSSAVHFQLPLKAGQELSITSKTHESTMLILNILARKLTGNLNEAFWTKLAEVSTWVDSWLVNWKKNSEEIYRFAEHGLLYDLLANNASLATARQLSLAYREGLHNCTAVWECADYAHGQYHSSKLGSSYVAQMFFPQMIENTKEYKMLNYILDHGGRVLLYTASEIQPREQLMIVKLPMTDESIMPLIESPVAETLLGRLFGPDWVKDH